MTSSYDYWKEREEEQKKHNITEESEYNAELRKIYKDMMNECQRDINAFYAKYADKKGLTISETKKKASKLDIEEYARRAEEYVKNKDFSKEANDAMKIYNLTMKANRLELLKADLGLELAKGHNRIYQIFYKALHKRANDTYKRQSGILGKTVMHNSKFADSIVNASFHNATFSERIWMHQELLKKDLHKLLQVGLIQGKNPRVLAVDVRKRFGVKTSDAERLMRTELARVQTDAQKKSYEDNEYDEYEYIACGGGDVCDACKALDGEHFAVKKMMPGDNAPPMHPGCHCSTGPYMDRKRYNEWLEHLEKGGTTEEWEALKRDENEGKAKSKSNKLKEFYAMDNVGVRMKVENTEHIIQDKDSETAYIYDTNGNLLLMKHGDKGEVEFTADELDLMKNAIATHNHPSGTTLSPDDIYMAIEHNLQEIRATGSKGTYVLRRNENLSLMPNKTSFEKEYGSVLKKCSRAYFDKYDKKISELHYQQLLQMNAMAIMAKKYGLLYWREKNEAK